MSDNTNLELSLKIQADLKEALTELEKFRGTLVDMREENTAHTEQEISDIDRLGEEYQKYSKQQHEQYLREKAANADSAQAKEENKAATEALAASLDALLESIDPALKKMASLDEKQAQLLKSHEKGLISEDDTRRFLAQIEAQRLALDGVSKGAKSFNDVEAGAKNSGRAIEQAQSQTQAFAEQLSKLKSTVLAVAGISFGASFIRDLGKTADEFSNLSARVKLVTTSNEQAKQSFAAVIRLSNETSQHIGATAELYTRLARALKDSASQTELLQVTSTINKAAIVSGATAQEARGAIIQLSQGLASGVLRGQEFNSVAEQMPRVMDLLQKSLGKTRGELRKMAEQGLLTTEVVFKALKDGTAEIDAEFSQMPLTLERAMTQMANGWVEFVGGANDAMGVTQLFASVIVGLSQNLSALAVAVLAVSVAVAGRKVAAFLAAAQAARLERLETVLLAEAELAQAKAAVSVAQAELARASASNALNLPKRIQLEEALNVALAKQAVAEKALQASRAGDITKQGNALSRLGGGVMGLMGGPMGLAITGLTLAVGGLTSAYMAAREYEAKLEQQHKQTIRTLEDQTDKTNLLIDAQGRLRQGVSLGDAYSQQQSNKDVLKEDEKKLADLQKRADSLREVINTMMANPNDSGLNLYGNVEELKKVEKQISQLSKGIDSLNDAQEKASKGMSEGLLAALNMVEKNSKTVADNVEANFTRAVDGTTWLGKAVTDAYNTANLETNKIKAAIKKGDEFTVLVSEIDKTKDKLEKDLANAAGTAAERLQLFTDKVINMAVALNRSPEEIEKLKAALNELTTLQTQIDEANEAKKRREAAKRQGVSAAKAAENYVKQLEKQAATLGMTQAQVRAYEMAEKGLTGTLQKRAQAALAIISAEEKLQQALQNSQLQVQLLESSGQTLDATLLSLRTNAAQMRKELEKTGNTDGVALLDKLLPAQEAKARADELKSQIERVQQAAQQDESRIQTKMDTGLISELAGRRQLVELHKQTAEQIEAYLPQLRELTELPGEAGRNMQTLLTELENQLLVIRSTTDDLTQAFKDGLQDGMESSITGLANRTMELGDAVRNLAQSVINAMLQIATRNLASLAMEGLFGAADAATKTAADSAGSTMYATAITASSTSGAAMYTTAFAAGVTALTTGMTAAFSAGSAVIAAAIAGASAAAGGASTIFSAGLKGLGLSFSEGGQVVGAGTGTSDSIVARLSNGEFVMKTAAVNKWGVGFLTHLNQGRLPAFASGGLVSPPSFAPSAPISAPTDSFDAKDTGRQRDMQPVLQQHLVIDPNEVLTGALSSPTGEKTFMTFIRTKKSTLRQLLGVDK